MSEQRLIEIETKVLFQEDTIEQLNKVIVQQDEQIRKMQTVMDQLVKNFKSLVEMTQETKQPGHEKPPHY